MKALITGLTGFVGPYLKEKLESQGYEVFGLDRTNPENIEDVFCGDVCDPDFVDDVFAKVLPDEVYHLAGFSSVKKSFDEPALAMQINFGGTQNILESVRKHSPKAKILIVSSADVYGNPASLPISEDEPTKGTSPYSKSRIAQEGLVGDYDDLFVVVSRSFNHTGPGQAEAFVLSGFAKQIVEIEKGLKEPIIYTGDLDVVRDFSDVRDVVNAYYMLLQGGKSGEVYNVGSGVGFGLRDLLDKMIDRAGTGIEAKKDPSKVRPIEIMKLVADISKLKKETGWGAGYSIDRTIDDLLNYWRNKL